MNAFYTLIGLFVAHFGDAQCNLSLNNTFIICDYDNLPLSLENGYRFQAVQNHIVFIGTVFGKYFLVHPSTWMSLMFLMTRHQVIQP